MPRATDLRALSESAQPWGLLWSGVGDLRQTAFAEPAALTAQRELKLGAPLKTAVRTQRIPRGHWVPNNNLCWSATWPSQVFSAAVWLQVAFCHRTGLGALAWYTWRLDKFHTKIV